jgi:hypothetical protein
LTGNGSAAAKGGRFNDGEGLRCSEVPTESCSRASPLPSGYAERTTCFTFGNFPLGLDTGALRSPTVATLVFSGQAVFSIRREREHLWSSMPDQWLLVSSVIDLSRSSPFWR